MLSGGTARGASETACTPRSWPQGAQHSVDAPGVGARARKGAREQSWLGSLCAPPVRERAHAACRIADRPIRRIHGARARPDPSSKTAYPVRVQLRLTVPIPLVGTRRACDCTRNGPGPAVRVRVHMLSPAVQAGDNTKRQIRPGSFSVVVDGLGPGAWRVVSISLLWDMYANVLPS